MKTQSLAAFLLTLATIALAQAALPQQALYLRQPTLSPDNSEIAFSYKGDIWKVPASGGKAQRLTVHPARDYRPIWSPDGRNIAFASAREGQDEVYVIPAEGGAAVRLTYNTGDDRPCDWSPDGWWILTETDRLSRPDLEEVPVDGGPAHPCTGVSLEAEYFARYSADGRTIVYCDGSGFSRWWWEGLKSGASGQVWTLEHGTWPPVVKRITPEETQFLWPAFAGGDIVATSNATGVANIVRFEAGVPAPRSVTEFTASGVSWLSVSKDGSQAVFERNFRLWRIDLGNDSVREVIVEAPTDDIELPRVEESIDGKIEEFALSADGRKLTFVAGGELYLVPSEDPKRAVRLTQTDARELSCRFSRDGKKIFYISDRTGRQNLYAVDTRSGEETALTHLSDLDAAKPQVSPAGGRIAFYLSHDRIASIVEDGGKIDTLLLGAYMDLPIESTQEFRFSPDGRYLAYTAIGPDFNSDVWVHSFDKGIDVNMTRRSQYNHDPRWSPDGKYLTFSHSYNQESGLYALRLVPQPPEFAEARLDSLYEPAEKKGKTDSAKTAENLPNVEIDFERVYTRWQQVYPLAAEQAELVASPDGKYWLFVIDLPAGANLWKVAIDPDSEDKPVQLTTGSARKSGLTVDSKSKWAYFLQEGKLGRVGLDGKDQELLSFSADYDFHPALRREQKLSECWRLLANYYYDQAMHGASWDSLYHVYSGIMPHLALVEEWRELVRTFLGTLNSSHLDVYGGTPALATTRQSGYLGVEFDPVALRDGRYEVARALPGGPLELSGSDVKSGARLLSVNGTALGPHTCLDSLLAGTIGERVRLVFQGEKSDDRTVDVKPVAMNAEADLVYEDWVASRRRLVDSTSGGRLGYMHIRSMNQPGLDRFKRELTDQTAGYEGLIVDVRFNGGGWTSSELLAMLERQPFVLRNFRGSAPLSENKMRSFAVEKPGIMVMNQYSFSNAEIFAEGWRRLKLGKIVGYPTGAAVIGTSDYALIDGSFCRRPSIGAFTVDRESLEGNPRQPDIRVFNTQTDWLSGRDPQLEAAVQELLAELR